KDHPAGHAQGWTGVGAGCRGRVVVVTDREEYEVFQTVPSRQAKAMQQAAIGTPCKPPACITSGTGLGRIIPCCVIASRSWVAGLAVGGSNIFANIPS